MRVRVRDIEAALERLTLHNGQNYEMGVMEGPPTIVTITMPDDGHKCIASGELREVYDILHGIIRHDGA